MARKACTQRIQTLTDKADAEADVEADQIVEELSRSSSKGIKSSTSQVTVISPRLRLIVAHLDLGRLVVVVVPPLLHTTFEDSSGNRRKPHTDPQPLQLEAVQLVEPRGLR